MKFQSIDAFHEAVVKLKSSGKKANAKILSAYVPKASQKQSWQEAVDGK